jgi:hypothetical protein
LKKRLGDGDRRSLQDITKKTIEQGVEKAIAPWEKILRI